MKILIYLEECKMATVGQVLTAPEAGWKRFDNLDSKDHLVFDKVISFEVMPLTKLSSDGVALLLIE
jgi:hypothetical protein